MTSVPSPAQLAGRFQRRQPALPRHPATAPLPTGWDDALDFPIDDRHFYLDTGIYHSLAGVNGATRTALAALISGHERNATIRTEVLTQKDEPLYSMRVEILGIASQHERRECSLPSRLAAIETIRSELMADSQIRHRTIQQTSTRRDQHGGEAELIHLAELHSPAGSLLCNDAGASAIGLKHGISSAHFVHMLRAAVRAAAITPDDALKAGEDGLSVSKLASREKARTCCEAWLGT